MEKETECEIVQDLLLGYVDDVLNEESKKLVEKHLSQCEICQKKLKELKTDIMENENNQKREIDYLKKVRRKSKIKAILMAFGIIVLVCFILYMRQFTIVQSIDTKAKKSLQSNNFYRETRDIVSMDNNVSVTKTYYKDGKCKKVWEIYSDAGKEIQQVQYSSKDAEETITIFPKENKVKIETGEFVKLMNQELNLKSVSYIIDDGIGAMVAKLGMAFVMSIYTDTYQIGREYYVLKNRFERNQNWETWIDKDTGLPLKMINRNSVRTFFPETDIVKLESDLIQEYQYKFEVVTDEDVEVPDLTGYEVEYTSNEEIEKLLSE